MKKRIIGIVSLLCVSVGAILHPSFAEDSSLQKRIQETLSRYEQVKGDEQFVDDSDMSGFDTKQAIKTVNELNNDIAGVIQDIETIQQQKQDNEQKYQAMLLQVKKVIVDITTTKKTIADAVTKINVYNKDIADTIRSLQTTRAYIIAAKESLSQLVQLMYLVQNDFYGAGHNIDDVKLLLKSDNISDTLSADEIMNALVIQFDTLIEDLIDHQTAYTAQYQNFTDLRAGYKKTVIAYEDKVQTLNEQKAYLMDFLKLYRSNKVVLDAEMNNLFQTRAQLKARIATVVRTVRDRKFSEAFLNSENYQAFLKLKDAREQRRNFFLRPVLPVSTIDTYFSLTGSEATEAFAGIKVKANQLDLIYAPANGIVYKVADQDGIAVNRMMIVHHDGYVSVMTNINKAHVKEGDIVRRGQIIGQIGGQQGTRGAGFQSKGEGLYFQIYQNGIAIDPLTELDLSVIPEKESIKEVYQAKYEFDMKERNEPIKMSDVPFVTHGKTARERTISFLQKYAAGPYADITLWEAAAKNTSVDIDLGICIGLAETSLGRYFASNNNIGNVGNNDRGDRVDKDSPLAGARSIYLTLNNSYLGGYHTIYELSGYGNKDGAIYASSPYNRQKNVSRCLSSIKGYIVPEDYPFRTLRENK